MSREQTALMPGVWTRRIAAIALTGALALGGVATVAAANGPGAANVDPQSVPQSAPEGTPGGQPEETPVGPPAEPGEQAGNASGSAIEGAGRPDEPGRPDGVGAAGNGNMPELPGLPTLPDEASDQARDALAAVADLHEQIADRIEAVREMPAGPERGAAVSEIAKDFGEQFRALAEALADDEE